MRIVERLQQVGPIVNEILRVSGGQGAVVGILHRGQVIHHANFGVRDSVTNIPPDQDTIFQVASLSKAFTAAAVGVLVEDGKLQWDTPLREILPEFSSIDPNVTELCNVVDLLSHKTGNSGVGGLWLQGNNIPLLHKYDLSPGFATAQYAFPFRSKFGYSNMGYGMAGKVIETLSGQPYADFIYERFFEPLGMRRSSVACPEDSQENIAAAYAALEDRNTVPIPVPKVCKNALFDSALGIRSTVSDLLQAYKFFLSTIRSSFDVDSRGEAPISSFKQVPHLITSRVPINTKFPSLNEQSYAFGWARAQLPGPLGAVGQNPRMIGKDNMPVIGRGAQSNLAIYHQGDLAGSQSSVILFPATSSAIVVLSNSMALNDCADWIGQAYAEALLNCTQRTDFVGYATSSAEAMLDRVKKTNDQLAKNRKPGTRGRDRQVYIGRYYHPLGSFHIEILAGISGNLVLRFQGIEAETYELRHYHDDVFEYSLPFDEIARRARLVVEDYREYLIRFHFSDKTQSVTSLTWMHDDDVPEGDLFRKFLDPVEDSSSRNAGQVVL